MNKPLLIIFGLVTAGIIAFLTFLNSSFPTKLDQTLNGASPSPKTIELFPYKIPELPIKRAYVTFLVGDSMLGSLGPNANQLRLDLIKLYPDHEFVNYNYGFGSTNILSVPNRMHSQSTYLGQNYPPVLGEQFDLIIFDSFAYNPLSEYPLEEGLKKQTEILDQSIRETIRKHPNSVVAILVPIAPSSTHFAEGTLDLSPEQRKQWTEERTAYIKNAIDFAEKNNIPLINVYEKSLTPQGDGDLRYINASDYIHPSVDGVKLISQTIADFIFQNHIFPE